MQQQQQQPQDQDRPLPPQPTGPLSREAKRLLLFDWDKYALAILVSPCSLTPPTSTSNLMACQSIATGMQSNQDVCLPACHAAEHASPASLQKENKTIISVPASLAA